MQLRVEQHSPIYQQIIDEFKRSIARGELKPGERIPSQRELATVIQVNPNTVQRAYREMEQAGITQTLRGQGTFVCDDPRVVPGIRRDMARNALVSFVREMRELGYNRTRVTQMVHDAYDNEIPGGDTDGRDRA